QFPKTICLYLSAITLLPLCADYFPATFPAILQIPARACRYRNIPPDRPRCNSQTDLFVFPCWHPAQSIYYSRGHWSWIKRGWCYLLRVQWYRCNYHPDRPNTLWGKIQNGYWTTHNESLV